MRGTSKPGFLNILDILIWFITIILIITSLFIIKFSQQNRSYDPTSVLEESLIQTKTLISLASTLPLSTETSHPLSTLIMLSARRPPLFIGDTLVSPGGIVLQSDVRSLEAQRINQGRPDNILTLHLKDCAQPVPLTQGGKVLLPASIRQTLIPTHDSVLITQPAFCMDQQKNRGTTSGHEDR